MSKHTKGPWSLHPFKSDGLEVFVGTQAYRHWSFSIGQGKKITAEVKGYSDGGRGYPRPDNREEVLANAKLIAAAPEMFELMERIVEQEPPIEWWETRRLARGILNKAKGENV